MLCRDVFKCVQTAMGEFVEAVKKNWPLLKPETILALEAVPREKFAPADRQSEALADKKMRRFKSSLHNSRKAVVRMEVNYG